MSTSTTPQPLPGESETTVPDAGADAVPHAGRQRGPTGWRIGLVAILIIVAQRGLLVAAGFLHGGHRLFRWDANWYQDVANHGYVWTPPAYSSGRAHRPNLAFFPLLPMGARWLHRLTGVGINPLLVGIALLGLPFAAWGIGAVGTQLANRRTGLILVALWGAAPRGLVTILPYTEALFTAIAAWCLYAMLRRHWWRAALLCTLAGVTRSSVGILLVTLGLAWLWSRWRDLGHVRTWVQGIGLAVVSASGLVAYMAYVAHCTGRWDGYVQVQKAWRMQMGSPLVAWHQIPAMWHAHGEWVSRNYSVVVVLGATVLMLATLAVRPPLPVWGYTLVSVGWAWAAQNYFWAKPRFLLPAFPLGLAPALLLARLPRWLMVMVLVLVTAFQCVIDAFFWAGRSSP